MDTVGRGGSQFDSFRNAHDEGKQWYSVRNIEPFVIPPFACMQLRTRDGDPFCVQEVEDDVLAWTVGQCDISGAGSGNPALFVFNGPQPIAPYPDGYGRASWSFPVQALHNGPDILANGAKCGPVAGSWLLHSRGRGFVCLSHDRSKAHDVARASSSIGHSVWVMPMPFMVESFGTYVGSLASATITVEANKTISLSKSSLDDELTSDNVMYWALNEPEPASQTVDGEVVYGLTLPFAGRYRFASQGTFSLLDETNPGNALGYRVQMWRSSDGSLVDPPLRVLRYHDVERDLEQAIEDVAAESLSLNGYVIGQAGDMFVLRAIGGDLSVGNLNVTLERVGELALGYNSEYETNGLGWL